MIIKSLQLNNFRQYKGLQKIIFSTDKEKNVTVIKGENGSGKTTLLEAFIWCFYGKLTLPNADRILTADISNSMKNLDKEEVYVEINFIHNEKEYFVRRSTSFQKNNLNEIRRSSNEAILQIKNDDGTLKTLRIEELYRIIPEDLSTYFFFDGERIENMSKSNREGKRDLNLAIRNILGLDVVSNAKKHLVKVETELEKEFSNSADEKIKEIKINLDNKRELIVDKKNTLQEYNLELDEIENNLKSISDQLKSYDELRELEMKRIEKDGKLNSLKVEVEKLEGSIKQINKRGLPEYLVNKLLVLYKDKIDLSSLENKGVIGIDGAAIDYIINRGECICGQEIKAGNIYFDNLIKQKEYQPPANLGIIINQFAEKTDEVSKVGKEYSNEINHCYIELENKRRDIESLDDELEELSKKLIGIDTANNLEEKRKELIRDKRLIEEKIEHLDVDINSLNNDINNLEGDLQASALKDKNNKITGIRIEYVKELIKEVNDFYIKRDKNIRNALNEKVTSIFSELLCTRHTIVIDDDYSFVVKDIDGEESTSQGQDVITSFAFIAGIIALAREKHKDIEVNEPYPLIMDAPFAKLSKSHRKNVAKLLPNITEQFILITVDSQYEGDIENTLRDKIGLEYELLMHTDNEKYTEIVGGN